jgi:thiol-disulfide isomerase/thioredoxin
VKRRAIGSGLLAGVLLCASTLVPAQDKPGVQGGLTIEAPGRINPEALFAATLYDLDNKAAPFASHRGRPMIINFWARWCPPCRVEIPELVALQLRKTGVDVIGINIETNPEPVRDFGRAYDINYPVWLTRAPGIDLMRSLGNSQAGLPFTVVINKHGVVVASRMGAMTRAQLDAAVELALK